MASITQRTIVIEITSQIIGTVIKRKIWRLVAPSMRAASNMSVGILSAPARMRIVKNPANIQISPTSIAQKTFSGAVQATLLKPSSPSALKTLLSRP